MFKQSARGLLLFALLWAQCARCTVAEAATGSSSSAQSTARKQSATARGVVAAAPLELGVPIKREIAGGQTHVYKIALAAGQYAKVEIGQGGVDVVARLFGADGNFVTGYNYEIRLKQSETVELVAGQSGDFRVEIQTTAEDAAGLYEIRLAESRAATARDGRLFDARTLLWKAIDLRRASKYDESLPPATRALEIAEKELGADDALVGLILNHLGIIQTEKGNYPAALALLQRAFAVSEKSLGAEHPQTVDSLHALSLYYRRTGDNVKAVRMHRQVLEIDERTLGQEHPRVASALSALGSVLNSLGDNAQAEGVYLRALAIAEKSLGEEHPLTGEIVNGLGVINLDGKNYDRAEQYFQRTLEIQEKTRGADAPEYSSTLQNLGIIYRNRKQYDKALEVYARALVIREKALGEEHPNIGYLLNNVANIYKATGNYAKALELQQRVRDIAEKSVGPYHDLTFFSIGNTATIYAAQGDAAGAVAYQKLWDERYEKVLALNLTIGSERQKLALVNTLSERTSRTISLHLNLAKGDQTAVDAAALAVLQRKGRVLDAVAANLTALRLRAGADGRELLDRLNAVTAQLAKLALNKPAKMAPEEHQKQLAELEAQKEQLEREISNRGADFGVAAPNVTLDAVKAEIPPDAALVEFAVYRPFNPKAENNNEAYGDPRYIAYVLRRQGDVQWADVGDARAVDTAVDEWRQALRDPRRGDAPAFARGLDEKIMRPVRALQGDATRLLISPDGELSLIPFEALMDERGQYLLQRFAFSYLSSGRDLLRMKAERESRSNPLLIANPSFGEPAPERLDAANRRVRTAGGGKVRRSVTATRTLSETYFAPLGGTTREVRSIQTLFADATVLDGARATETALKQATAPRLLHVATHGFFLQDDTTSPAPAARGADARSVPGAVAAGSAPQSITRGVNTKPIIENPLLRSGLALAGANARAGGDGKSDDGILTALEAAGLNLWGTRLVVLSACDTGVGEVRVGEGVYGLRRAFVLAGAESLVMSLWPVSDYSTRRLMTDYYKNLKAGLGRGAALRQVQLDMLRRDPKLHPFYWANFIQSGEWADLQGKR